MLFFSKLGDGDIKDADKPTAAELADDGNSLMINSHKKPLPSHN